MLLDEYYLWRILLRMRARAKMIVRVGCVLQGVTSESFVYECALRVLFKAHGEVGRGDDRKCRGEEAGNMLLRRTRRSTHNNRPALVNVHDDAPRCCLGKGKTRFTLDCTMECRAFKLKKELKNNLQGPGKFFPPPSFRRMSISG